MANPHRGEVALQAGDKSYRVSFSINAMCSLEEHFDRSVVEVMGELESARTNPASLRIKTVRGIVWAALQDHHPGTTIEEAGDVVSQAGVPAVMEKIAAAITIAFPPAPAGSAGGKGKPKAAGG